MRHRGEMNITKSDREGWNGGETEKLQGADDAAGSGDIVVIESGVMSRREKSVGDRVGREQEGSGMDIGQGTSSQAAPGRDRKGIKHKLETA